MMVQSNFCLIFLLTALGCATRLSAVSPHEPLIPTELNVQEGVIAYSTMMSFAGFEGVIVLDNGEAFAVGDTKSRSKVVAYEVDLPDEVRGKLAKLFNENEFFRFPDHLHDPECFDGNEAGLYAATRYKAHESTNYMDPSSVYHRVYDEFRKVVPYGSGTKTSWHEVVESLDDYANELAKDDPRRSTVIKWREVMSQRIGPRATN